VEQDASVILETVLHTMSEALDKAGLSKSSVRAVGLTNQRETTVVWDRHTGKALHPAIGTSRVASEQPDNRLPWALMAEMCFSLCIVWSDVRTSGVVDELKAAGRPSSALSIRRFSFLAH
jgi:glycerol kinase